MEKDYTAEQIGRLDGIFANPRNSNLFTAEHHTPIQNEFANRWVHENRLDLLHDLAKKYREEEVLAVIDKIIYENCKKDWEQLGLKKGNKTKFCVTKCPMYDLAKKLSTEKWLYHLTCLTDEPAITGFNGRIKFARSRTLMQGYPDCDHCYTDLS
jgi:hypothetical protein